MRRSILTIAVPAFALLAVACSPRELVIKQVVGSTSEYLDPPEYRGTSFDPIADNVHSFRWKWYRNLVVETADGFFVTDPFNQAAAESLAATLKVRAPDKPVHTLFYSHYHLDHTRGGAALTPQRVLGHADNPRYWERVDAKGILAQTEGIEGDVVLRIGGVTIELLYLDDSHSDTIYAVYLPEQKVLWTADLGLVQTFPPFGGPDMYWPGVEDALARLSELDFETFVPSHFGVGTRQDFLDYVEFVDYTRSLAAEALAEIGPPGSRQSLDAYYELMYPKMQERYGHWHGFDQMALEQMFHGVAASLLGH